MCKLSYNMFEGTKRLFTGGLQQENGCGGSNGCTDFIHTKTLNGPHAVFNWLFISTLNNCNIIYVQN